MSQNQNERSAMDELQQTATSWAKEGERWAFFGLETGRAAISRAAAGLRLAAQCMEEVAAGLTGQSRDTAGSPPAAKP